MDKKIISIVVCMLMCATVIAGAQPEKDNDKTDSSLALTSNANSQPLFSPGDILIDLDVGTPAADTQCLGGEWDGTYFWVTGGNSGADPNKLYKFDISGTLVNTYTQPTAATGWGIRDLAFDGTYLYGGCETGFWKIDPASGVFTLMFSSISPMTVIRALEWVPSEGMFYTGSFALGWYKFTPDGSQKIPVTNPGLSGVYGMAYDDINDTLWVFDQGAGGGETKFYEYDYQSGTLTGKTWVIPMLSGLSAQIAGGAFYATDIVTGTATLCGVVQGTPVDKLFVMELGITNLPPNTPGGPNGPTSGIINVSYDFTATTTDPESDQVYYMFDWDDGSFSSWVGPYASGSIGTASHAWTTEGTYNVKVKAKDSNGAESGWSPSHEITILGVALEIGAPTGGLFKIKSTVKNIGGATANKINWTMTLTGGFVLLGKITTGSILVLDPGADREIASSTIIGFGKTVVKITASIPGYEVSKEQNATILLFFISIK